MAPTSVCRADSRTLAAASYATLLQRYPHYARGLLWCNTFWIVPRPSLLTVLWPTPTTRQNQNHGIRQLVAHRLIEPTDELANAFRLGTHGVRVLNAHGIAARYRHNPALRVANSLLLAGEFASALSHQLMSHAYVSRVSWREEPFVGQGARADAFAYIEYRLDVGKPPGPSVLVRELGLLPPRTERMRVYLEIDRATETLGQLEQRVQNWARVPRPPDALGAERTIWLWVTTGNRVRARAIRDIWAQHLRFTAALVTTTHELRGGTDDRPFDPLTTVWRATHVEWVQGGHIIGIPRLMS